MTSGNLTRRFSFAIATLLMVCGPLTGHGQANISEDFTHGTTINNWYFFNGACLTAGTSTSSASPGSVPSCLSIASSYYKENLVGGSQGFLGASTAPGSPASGVPDPDGQGALRFTNGKPGGYRQNGAIVSAGTPFPTGTGVQVTFKTVTYGGDYGGAAQDGADGMSFYLMDGSKPAGVGAWGGSLGYSCSNANPPYDGLVGGYLGLGIDEYGNFLNGTSNTLGESGTSATGDNTASGGGYQPGRIGLRGAGSVSWAALTAAYGTNLGSSSPYYPASLTTTCSNGGVYNSSTNSCGVACTSGSYNSSRNTCDTCPAGSTFNSATNSCNSCPSGSTYNVSTNSCSPAAVCSVGGPYIASTNSCTTLCSSGTYNPTTKKCDTCSSANGTGLNSGFTCAVCPSGATYDSNTANGSTPSKPCAQCSSGSWTYSSSTGQCTRPGRSPTSPTWVAQTTTGPNASNPNTPTPILPTSVPPTTSNPSTGVPVAPLAVQNTCRTGTLYNYSNPSNPQAVGAMQTGVSWNPAGILDYPAIPSAYKVLTSTTIANESAATRSQANVIAYKLKITPDGLLSFSYSYNGGSYQSVLAKQNITTSNGPLPNTFQFGFAGSTGGSTNVHEILCFQATPSEQANTSIGLNAKQAARIANGTQAYLAAYYQSNWTGSLTANDLLYNASQNIVTISSTANWDASCVLTGVPSSQTCPTTGVSGPVAAQGPTSRTILSWDGTQGIPFEWSNLTSTQQAALDSGDSSSTNTNRLNYLRGDRTNEVNTSGVGLFRPRESVLGDIIDSSPTWVGPPSSPYAVAWTDALNSSASAPENSGTQSYAQFKSSAGTRLNVVYTGANDGLLHGFRAGSYDSNNNYVNNSTTPNDGHEVLAYMPGAVISGKVVTNGGTSNSVVDTIHGTDPTNSNAVDSSLDYSSTQYGHNFYIDATPGTGDLFYGGTWHTWAVGGFGAGGAALYALDVTDPTQFSESNAAHIVMGEWTAASITCVNVTNCGNSLGNTYGQPMIRRLHNGTWGAIFGNGFGSFNGDAGIYVMTVDSSGTPTFYYLSTGVSGNNGIAYVYPADLDGDRIIDYVYAGDLQGNIWRFDLTASSASSWAGPSTPLFSTPGGQPITSKVVVWGTQTTSSGPQRLMIDFGTGRKIPITNSTPVQYAGGTQYLYGIWDWDMSAWNAMSTTQYASLTGPQTIVATGGSRNLQIQTATLQPSGELDGTSNPVCWAGSTTCAGGAGANTQFGWELALPGASEQVIYNPVPYKGALFVNTLIPAGNSITSCANVLDTGNTIAISLSTGGVVTGLFPGYRDAIGFRTDGSGSVTIVNGGGHDFVVTQSSDGRGQQPAGVCTPPNVWSPSGGCTLPINPQGPTGKRLTWIKKR